MTEIVARTPRRCSRIRDIVTTKDGEVTEERTVWLENDAPFCLMASPILSAANRT